MRLQFLNCIFLLCIVVTLGSDESNRTKRDLLFLKNLIASKILGIPGPSPAAEPGEPILINQEGDTKIYRVPGFENILVKAVPKTAVNEIIKAAPVKEKPSQLEPAVRVLNSYLGNDEEALKALFGINNLNDPGVLIKPRISINFPPKVPLIPVLPPTALNRPAILNNALPPAKIVNAPEDSMDPNYTQLKKDGNIIIYSADQPGNIVMHTKPFPRQSAFIVTKHQQLRGGPIFNPISLPYSLIPVSGPLPTPLKVAGPKQLVYDLPQVPSRPIVVPPLHRSFYNSGVGFQKGMTPAPQSYIDVMQPPHKRRHHIFLPHDGIPEPIWIPGPQIPVDVRIKQDYPGPNIMPSYVDKVENYAVPKISKAVHTVNVFHRDRFSGKKKPFMFYPIIPQLSHPFHQKVHADSFIDTYKQVYSGGADTFYSNIHRPFGSPIANPDYAPFKPEFHRNHIPSLLSQPKYQYVSPIGGYSYKQLHKDGSVTTYTNLHDNSIIPGVGPTIPPIISDHTSFLSKHNKNTYLTPLAVVGRFDGTGASIGSTDMSKTPPLGLVPPFGRYSYKQVNRDGSITTFGNERTQPTVMGRFDGGSAMVGSIKLPKIYPLGNLPSTGRYSYKQVNRDGSITTYGNDGSQSTVLGRFDGGSALVSSLKLPKISPLGHAPSSERYSYKQMNRDGSITTFGNGVQHTKLTPLPQFSVSERFDSSAGMVGSSEFAKVAPTAPVMPSGSYSYKQTNQDGSVTTFGNDIINKGIIKSNHGGSYNTRLNETKSTSQINLAHPSLKPTVSTGGFTYKQMNHDGSITTFGNDAKTVMLTEPAKLIPESPQVIKRVDNFAKITHGFDVKSTTLPTSGNHRIQPVVTTGGYTYKQLNQDGSITTFGKDVPIVIATEPAKLMPAPPVHIIKRVENVAGIAHGFDLNKIIAKAPALTPVKNKIIDTKSTILPTPSYVTSPSIQPVVSTGGYSYKQVNQDGSISTFGKDSSSIVVSTKPAKFMPLPPVHIIKRVENVAGIGHEFDLRKIIAKAPVLKPTVNKYLIDKKSMISRSDYITNPSIQPTTSSEGFSYKLVNRDGTLTTFGKNAPTVVAVEQMPTSPVKVNKEVDYVTVQLQKMLAKAPVIKQIDKEPTVDSRSTINVSEVLANSSLQPTGGFSYKQVKHDKTSTFEKTVTTEPEKLITMLPVNGNERFENSVKTAYNILSPKIVTITTTPEPFVNVVKTALNFPVSNDRESAELKVKGISSSYKYNQIVNGSVSTFLEADNGVLNTHSDIIKAQIKAEEKVEVAPELPSIIDIRHNEPLAAGAVWFNKPPSSSFVYKHVNQDKSEPVTVVQMEGETTSVTFKQPEEPCDDKRGGIGEVNVVSDVVSVQPTKLTSESITVIPHPHNKDDTSVKVSNNVSGHVVYKQTTKDGVFEYNNKDINTDNTKVEVIISDPDDELSNSTGIETTTEGFLATYPIVVAPETSPQYESYSYTKTESDRSPDNIVTKVKDNKEDSDRQRGDIPDALA